MATRLEKETLLREKAQLEARLDKLFKTQEAQTVGKKERRQMAKGGVFDRLRSNTQAIFQGNPNPNYSAVADPGYGVLAYNPPQYQPYNLPGNPGRAGFNMPSGGTQPGRSGFNMPTGGYGVDAVSGATQHDYEGPNPSPLKSGSTTGIPGAKAAPSTRTVGSEAALRPLSPLGSGQLGGGITSTGRIKQAGPLPASSYSGRGDQLKSTAAQAAYNPYLSSNLGIESGGGRQPAGGGGRNFNSRGAFNAAATGLSFAGSIYDTIRGLQKPTQFDAQDFYNPQYGRAQAEYTRGIGLMANRRYDPSAELEDVERTGSVYRQGLRNLPTGTGALQNRLAGQATREQRQKGQIWNKKQNADLGFRGQEAQYRAGAARGLAALGSERAQTRFRVADYNERSAAGRRNMLSAGLGGLGLGAQNQQLMANQRSRDTQLMGILPSYGGGMYNYAGGSRGIQFGGEGMTDEEILKEVRGYK